MASKYAPVISATGITAPNFATNFANLQADFQSIYGVDAYISADSQDGQWLGVLAQAFTDLGAAVVAAYNSFSPTTAQGAGLSSNVKMNGLQRLIPTYSIAFVTLTGVAGTTITNGQCFDANNNIWNLPPSVQIAGGGTISVFATCATLGAVAAAANTITGIQTPTYGWQSVTNQSAATVGAPIETDAALRVRQSESVSLPSVTIFEGIVANILNLVGVTRVRGYENNTNTTNGNGIPANTLYFLVEGTATSLAICTAIAAKITPGVATYGSTTQTITDTTGSTRVIKYDAPIEETIKVNITVHALNGWVSSTSALIQAALVAYINELPIGTNVSYTGVFVPAFLIGTPQFATFTITALTLALNSGGFAAADVTIPYNGAPSSATTNITVTVA